MIGKKCGFSIVEVLVALVVLGLVVVIVTGGLTSVFQAQKSVSARDEANEFAAGLGRFFFEQETCTSIFKGRDFPLAGSQVPLSITGLPGYPGSVQSGYVISNATQVGSLTFEDATSGTPPTVRRGGVVYTHRILRVKLVMAAKNTAGQMQNLSPRSFHIPVYVDALGKIVGCEVGLKIEDSCDVIGSIYDSVTGKCRPMTSCQVAGTYVTRTCNPSSNNCGPGINNPVTGAQSCPAGASASQTGVMSDTFTEGCGKKCTRTVTRTTSYYICLKCN
jgi:prepilin-type N-terminal cleavage/methylation domain-containing protein